MTVVASNGQVLTHWLHIAQKSVNATSTVHCKLDKVGHGSLCPPRNGTGVVLLEAGMCRVSLKEMSDSSHLSPDSKLPNFCAAVAYPPFSRIIADVVWKPSVPSRLTPEPNRPSEETSPSMPATIAAAARSNRDLVFSFMCYIPYHVQFSNIRQCVGIVPFLHYCSVRIRAVITPSTTHCQLKHAPCWTPGNRSEAAEGES